MAEDDPAGGCGAAASQYRVHLCFGPNCSERGSRALWPHLARAIAEAGLGGRVEILATTCRNRCDYGPSMNVYPGPVFYNQIDEAAIDVIVREHLAGGHIAHRWLFRPKVELGRPPGSRKPQW